MFGRIRWDENSSGNSDLERSSRTEPRNDPAGARQGKRGTVWKVARAAEKRYEQVGRLRGVRQDLRVKLEATRSETSRSGNAPTHVLDLETYRPCGNEACTKLRTAETECGKVGRSKRGARSTHSRDAFADQSDVCAQNKSP